MSNKRFFGALTVVALSFLAALGGGGCGGSGDKSGPASPSSSVNRPETVYDTSDISLLLGMDIDDNGMPDFLDFEGVPQFHVDNSASDPSGEIFNAASILEAAEKYVPVPSMIWLNQLRLASEDANFFSVNLEAGKEYTFEFSKNLTEDLGGVLPSVKVYDPANAQLPVVEAEAMDCEIAAYPPERPSILCYTVKPAVSGTYLVEVSNGKPSVDENAGEMDTDSLLFIYEEFRNENGETGYYTNFKFQDEDGNKTESLGVAELIYLRQLFLEANPNYFEEVYGWGLPDDASGTGGAFDIRVDGGDYARAMYRLLSELGVQSIVEDDELSDEELERELEKLEQGDSGPSYELEPISELAYEGKVTVASRAAGGKAAVCALEDQPSRIETHIDGIPYDAQYEIGKGFLATSNFKFMTPRGSVEVDISDAYNKAREEYLNSPKDHLSLQTESYAKFVNTSMQAESLLKTTNNLSLATAAVGVSLGSGTTNNLKFGLTSTNLVIHYEEVENGYRTLKAKELKAAWDEAGLFGFIDDMPDGDQFLPEFRNDLGDYYVAGYQYGACYDAYISITTETSEQTREVEKKLSAALNLGDGDNTLNASADISSTIKDTLNEYGARIDVKIVTNGFGNSAPTVVPLGDGVASNDMKALDKVGESLAEFLSQVRSNTDRRNYAPVRVKLTRWRQNLSMASAMKRKGDKTGSIPVTIGHRNTIAGFNSQMKNLMGYHNVVGDNPDIPSAATADIVQRYKQLIETVTAAGESFYADKEAVANGLKQIEEISPKFKALADRYVFYRMLVRAQEAEKKIYDTLKRQADALGEGNNYQYVKQMPFGGNYGGSSGYDSFAYSSYVTEDIEAGGKELHKRYQRDNNANAFRREWHANHQEGQVDYLPSAGDATLTAKTNDGSRAVFCKVRVESTSKNKDTDRKRELVRGAPAVGTSSVGFEFLSGRGDDVDWNIYGKSMRMRTEDYPFAGLK